MISFSEPVGYSKFLRQYFFIRLSRGFFHFENGKDNLVGRLIKERGKYVRPFIHSGVIGLVFLGITLGPRIIKNSAFNIQNSELENNGIGGAVLGVAAYNQDAVSAFTQVSDKPPAEVREYTIAAGDTVGQIANKFDVSEDTIYWENNITPKTLLKPGEKLMILPVTGVRHTVSRGETVQSIAKKYDSSAQAVVDWPYNTFVNDETFELAVGQTLIVPDGVKPDEVQVSPRSSIARLTPDAGSITASGSWVWPAAGNITQGFAWYHKGLDIANKAGPVVVAADSGRVIAVNPGRFGYGNHVIIDHGNGFQTLYAHLSGFRVEAGQNIAKGAGVGVMGSTGRSTGTHLHFEIRQNGEALPPLNFLK